MNRSIRVSIKGTEAQVWEFWRHVTNESDMIRNFNFPSDGVLHLKIDENNYKQIEGALRVVSKDLIMSNEGEWK